MPLGIPHQSTSSSTMNTHTWHNIVINFMLASLRSNASSGPRTQTTRGDDRRERTTEPGGESHCGPHGHANTTNFRAVNKVPGALKEGELYPIGFLDALC